MTTTAALYFSHELLSWYLANKRILPWRMNRDPYRIWVSEVMLQQTRVDTVIPYYERFMDKFPTITDLATAPEAEVLKCWEGLGYYSRARNLQAGAQEVLSRHDGIVPDDKESVAALRGVGPYTSGAIMSIAFNRPEPAVDGNVMRVLSRYFLLEDDIAKPATRVKIEKLAASLIPEGSAGDFNQALMELGALVCTPKSPGCLTCPVMVHCEGRRAGMEHTLPIKTKAKPPRPETRLAALIIGKGKDAGKVLVRQRPQSGLLAKMWELPHVLAPQPGAGGAVKPPRSGRGRKAADAGTAASAVIEEQSGGLLEQHALQADFLCRTLSAEDGVLVRPTGWRGEAEHVFSHIVWDLQVFKSEFGAFTAADNSHLTAAGGVAGVTAFLEQRALYEPSDAAGLKLGAAAVAAEQELPLNYRWIGPEQMNELAFPNVFLKLLREYWENTD
ncbi:A/G-specific adenine glycosylase [Paenibacillus solisilvae]|uniref:Adenine DNA glycosylase n=1 Tax=Paenibacillus solisilvae TaxID=2486751 RepID=A0ABW0W676_9BACL